MCVGGRVNHRVGQVVMRLAVVAALSLAPMLTTAVALAVPTTGTTGEIEAKEAQRQAAIDEMERARVEHDIKTADFVQSARELERIRAEVSEVTTQLAGLDDALVKAEAAVVQRAIQLYRGDGVTMLALVLEARTIADFMSRANYLAVVNERDIRMVTGLRQARAESAWLHEHLAERVGRLEALRAQADIQIELLKEDQIKLEKKAEALGEDIAELMRRSRAFEGGEASGLFDPDTLITDANYRAVDSMTEAEIQRFLEGLPGSLATYKANDHTGKRTTVAAMVAEAAAAWNISPKVILVTMQKEQSLLEKRNPAQKSYDWAMGCGRADSRTFYQYKGFGKQIWFGAQKLDQNAKPWRPGIERTIDGSVVRMTNEATYSLYKYTPHFGGNRMFWTLYWRYFGDPRAISAP